jgi:hypothetical protein
MCPITQCVMTDPMVDPEGNTYERSAIERWLAHNKTSPVTRAPLTASKLAPNRALKDILDGLAHTADAVVGHFAGEHAEEIARKTTQAQHFLAQGEFARANLESACLQDLQLRNDKSVRKHQARESAAQLEFDALVASAGALSEQAVRALSELEVEAVRERERTTAAAADVEAAFTRAESVLRAQRIVAAEAVADCGEHGLAVLAERRELLAALAAGAAAAAGTGVGAASPQAAWNPGAAALLRDFHTREATAAVRAMLTPAAAEGMTGAVSVEVQEAALDALAGFCRVLPSDANAGVGGGRAAAAVGRFSGSTQDWLRRWCSGPDQWLGSVALAQMVVLRRALRSTSLTASIKRGAEVVDLWVGPLHEHFIVTEG